MNFLEKDLGVLGPDDNVEVTLDHAANVQLLDPTNYQAYKSGGQYSYVGGYVTQSPYGMRPPFHGRWYLVIDLGGAAGTVRASVRVLSNVS